MRQLPLTITPEAVAPAEAKLRVVHTGYVAPYWYGFPPHRNYLGASLGWHLDATDVRVDNTAQPVSAHVAYTGRQSAPPPAVTDRCAGWFVGIPPMRRLTVENDFLSKAFGR
jgi:hypothetical protein